MTLTMVLSMTMISRLTHSTANVSQRRSSSRVDARWCVRRCRRGAVRSAPVVEGVSVRVALIAVPSG